MARVSKTRNKNTRSSKKVPPVLSVEDRLKIFANIIVDQLIEEQRSGKLDQFQHGSI